MFELLLQADKSMSDGLFDQAERTYWQLIELDPTNAIAVAGLARIALQRGDERLARTFADRALGIDPDSIAARRVILALDEGRSTPTDPGPPDLQLIGAERLEALSRRRAATQEGEEAAEATGREKGSARSRTSGRVESLPSEPSRERRRAGRVAAAAAAAAAAAREPSPTRHEPHHAMPSGRHLFQPEIKAPGPDPFSVAEMAAAVAAVDSIDEAFEESVPSPAEIEIDAEAVAAPGLEPPVGEDGGDARQVLEAVDATGADESVSLRIALMSDMAEAPLDLKARGDSREPRDQESSEEEAEMQALHEAMAIVMADDEQDGPEEGSAQAAGPEVDVDAVSTHAGAIAATTWPVAWHQDEPPDAEALAPTPDEAEKSPRKKGLFRRFRGN